jgi:hypothetical protein
MQSNKKEEKQDILTIGHTLLPDETQHIEEQVFKILSDPTRKELMLYLRGGEAIKNYEVEEYVGTNILEHITKAKILIPRQFDYPRDFSLSMLPLTSDGKMFATVRKYNYLPTFKVSSLDKFDQQDVRCISANKLLQIQAQSRFTNLWRQLAAVLLALDSKYSTQDYPLRYYVRRLFFNKERSDMPFYEDKGIIFTDTNVASILPSYVYVICSVGIDILIGGITHVDSIIVMNNYLMLGEDSLFDTMLDVKSTVRSAYIQALHKIGTAVTPIWNRFQQVIGVYNKSTKENSFVQKQIEENIEKRKTKLNATFNAYIDRLIDETKDQIDVSKLFRFLHSATNPRLFYKTLVELSLDAAVQPKLYSKLVSMPRPVDVEVESEMAAKYEYEDQNTQEAFTYNHLRNYIPRMQDALGDIDMDERWKQFITTSSAGKRLTQEQLKTVPLFLRQWHNIRLFREAMQVSEYRSESRLTAALKDPVVLVVRQQIDRRQRTIAGLTNEKLSISFPSYAIGQAFYDLTEAVAQGKQTGNAADIENMLMTTSKEEVLLSSIDISGMDASIQAAVKMIYDSLMYNIADSMRGQLYGPFFGKEIRMLNLPTGVESVQKIPAVKQALMFQASNMQTATVYLSELFGSIYNYEGTFPSGRADTSTHHTVLLVGIIGGNEDKRALLSKPTYILARKVMGDDIQIVYLGSKDRTFEQAQSDYVAIQQLGFKVTLEISKNGAIFLQQQVVNGCYWGLANRVSFFTREHTKQIGSLSDACSELMALSDDISSRAEDIESLKLLLYSVGLFCLSRHTIAINIKDYDAVVASFTRQGIRTQVYEMKSDKGYDTRLLTIYAPYVWLFTYKGGQMPAPSMMMSNGEMIPSESIYTARGQAKDRIHYKLSNIKEMIASGTMYLDNAILSKYGFDRADYLNELDILGIEKEVRLSEIPTAEVFNLSSDLDLISDTTQKERSKQAFAELNELGVKIPRSVVFGYATETKMEQTIAQKELSSKAIGEISDRIIKKLKQAAKTKHLIIPRSDDVLHLYYIEEQDGKGLKLLEHAQYLHDVQISYNMSYMSDSWLIYALIGGPDYAGAMLRKEVSSIRGKFHDFKYDDPVFTTGLYLWHNHQGLLPLYFRAINANLRQETAFRNAFQYVDRYSMFVYKFVLSPRLIFFFNDNPYSVSELFDVDINTPQPGNKMYRALYCVFVYIELLSRINSLRGLRFKLFLHPLMSKHLIRLKLSA